MPHTILYCRVNHLVVDTTAALAPQMELARRHAGREKLEIARMYLDVSSGGLQLEHRPEFVAALEALQPGSILLIATPDRLAKRAHHRAALVALCTARGARVSFCHKQIGPAGEILTPPPLGH